jgi:hypothetical protein
MRVGRSLFAGVPLTTNSMRLVVAAPPARQHRRSWPPGRMHARRSRLSQSLVASRWTLSTSAVMTAMRCLRRRTQHGRTVAIPPRCSSLHCHSCYSYSSGPNNRLLTADNRGEKSEKCRTKKRSWLWAGSDLAAGNKLIPGFRPAPAPLSELTPPKLKSR